MAKIYFNKELNMFQWQDDNGFTLKPREVPVKERTLLVLEQIRRTPERIGLLKSFMILNRLPYHNLLKAGLTLVVRHPYSEGTQFVYRRDGLIDLYRDDKLYAIAYPNGIIQSYYEV